MRYGYHLVTDCLKASQGNKSRKDVEATIIHYAAITFTSITETKAEPFPDDKQADILASGITTIENPAARNWRPRRTRAPRASAPRATAPTRPRRAAARRDGGRPSGQQRRGRVRRQRGRRRAAGRRQERDGRPVRLPQGARHAPRLAGVQVAVGCRAGRGLGGRAGRTRRPRRRPDAGLGRAAQVGQGQHRAGGGDAHQRPGVPQGRQRPLGAWTAGSGYRRRTAWIWISAARLPPRPGLLTVQS